MLQLRHKTPLLKPKIITVQGQARGGKGSLVKALVEEFSSDYRVYKIDQGLKFRILARAGLDAGLDFEDLDVLRQFVLRPETEDTVLASLRSINEMDDQTLHEKYYLPMISNGSGMFGKLDETHRLVVSLLLNEVRGVRGEYDMVIIDGRAMRQYGRQLDHEGTAEFVLGVDVSCEPLVAARRVAGIFAALETLSTEQLISLLRLTEDISRRNSSDARRQSDPSLPLVDAYIFDVLHPPVDEVEYAKISERVFGLKALSVDNSYTKSISQFTEPAVKLIRSVVELSERDSVE